jgi:hypothetical protein
MPASLLRVVMVLACRWSMVKVLKATRRRSLLMRRFRWRTFSALTLAVLDQEPSLLSQMLAVVAIIRHSSLQAFLVLLTMLSPLPPLLVVLLVILAVFFQLVVAVVVRVVAVVVVAAVVVVVVVAVVAVVLVMLRWLGQTLTHPLSSQHILMTVCAMLLRVGST